MSGAVRSAVYADLKGAVGDGLDAGVSRRMAGALERTLKRLNHGLNEIVPVSTRSPELTQLHDEFLSSNRDRIKVLRNLNPDDAFVNGVLYRPAAR